MENIKVKDNDHILQNHVIECNKKFPTFICYCEIKNESFSGEMRLGWLSNPDVYLAGKLQSRYICDRNEFVNMKKVFITNLENQSYKQYLQQPKPTVEWKLIRLINENPNLIKKIEKSLVRLLD